MRLLVILSLLLALPAAAHAAVPPPIGTPGGVYTGKVRVAGVSAQACKGCRARIVLTHDGLEISGASEIAFGRRSRCSLRDPSDVEFVRIRRDGTYRTLRTESQNVPFTLVGRVTRTRVTGRSRVLCERGSGSIERRLTFTARRTGRVPFDRRAVVRCEPVGGGLERTLLLVTVRGVGCGLGHDAARGAPSLRCAVVAGGAVDPAAQRRCVPSGDPANAGTGPLAELTRLVRCTTRALDDRGLLVHATATVGCADARRYAAAYVDCEHDDVAAACAERRAFSCVRDELLRMTDSDTPLRCVDRQDRRRVLTLLFSSSDSV